MLEGTGCPRIGPLLTDLFCQKIFALQAVITLK